MTNWKQQLHAFWRQRLDEFLPLLAGYQWFRSLYGGTWFHVFVAFPFDRVMWIKVPDGATRFTYSEPLFRGEPIVETWPVKDKR